MPEDTLPATLRGHFSSSHHKGIGVSVPVLQGETEALVWDDAHMQTDGELAKHQRAGLQGAAGREVSNSVTNKSLDAHGRGVQETCDTCDKPHCGL